MNTDTPVVDAPEIPESVAVEPQPTPEPDAASVADHAAKFNPEILKDTPADGPTPAQVEAQRARDEAGRFAKESKERHRAKSQQAKAEDVPRIKELTAKWKDAERQLAELRQKQTTPPAQTTQTLAPPVTTQAALPSDAFTKPKPSFDDFQDQPDALEAWTLAISRWDRERERFEDQQATTVKTTQAAEADVSTAFQAWIAEVSTAYNAKEAAFEAKTPHYRAAVNAITTPTTPLLKHALLTSDNGPELVYYLATHPAIYDEMLLLTDGKAITDQAVASTQRLLATRSQAAPTGSAASAQNVRPLPKPPNPVRTGPIQASDEPPAEAASISEHKRYYGAQR